jgi:GntR family transcriptional regulator, vanillate catabolism transcriptional regulator
MMVSRAKGIVDQIRDLIFSGELAPGEKLLEISMAARLNISRTPLRPALAVLAQEGLLERRGARGFVVRRVSLRDVMDAYLVRANLEGLATSIVAQNSLSDEATEQFKQILTLGDRLLEKQASANFQSDFRAMNEKFHDLILAETKNACLTAVAEKTLKMPLLSTRVVHFNDVAALSRSHNDHWAIFEAIYAHEAERARSIMTEHILRSRDILRRQMRLPGEGSR